MRDGKRLSDAKIWAMQQVLTSNQDIVELLSQKGILVEDVEILCSQAMSDESPWRRLDV